MWLSWPLWCIASPDPPVGAHLGTGDAMRKYAMKRTAGNLLHVFFFSWLFCWLWFCHASLMGGQLDPVILVISCNLNEFIVLSSIAAEVGFPAQPSVAKTQVRILYLHLFFFQQLLILLFFNQSSPSGMKLQASTRLVAADCRAQRFWKSLSEGEEIFIMPAHF